jgi:WD40 repeat protein
VASDHSVTLLSLQERKCVTLASRHLFPVVTIKWRPLDDFLIVGCSDGTVYVWQMETGHLDRVLHGMLAEEVLNACDEHSGDGETVGGSTSEVGLSNPAVHFFRGLRHRNINAIKHATQRGIHQLQQLNAHNTGDGNFLMKNRNSPLIIQGLRTNPKGRWRILMRFGDISNGKICGKLRNREIVGGKLQKFDKVWVDLGDFDAFSK